MEDKQRLFDDIDFKAFMGYDQGADEALIAHPLALTKHEYDGLYAKFENMKKQEILPKETDFVCFLRFICLTGNFVTYLPYDVREKLIVTLSLNHLKAAYLLDAHEVTYQNIITLPKLSPEKHAYLWEKYQLRASEPPLRKILKRGIKVAVMCKIQRNRKPTKTGKRLADQVATRIKKVIELLEQYQDQNKNGRAIHAQLEGLCVDVLPLLKNFVTNPNQEISIPPFNLPADEKSGLFACVIPVKLGGRPSQPWHPVLCADLDDLLRARSLLQYDRMDIVMILQGMGAEFAEIDSENLNKWLDERITTGRKLRVDSIDSRK